MKIGLSFDEGDPVYRFYVGALMAAAEQAGIDVQPFWLAGADRPIDEVAIQTMDGLILTGGADVEPQHYGLDDRDGVCKPFPGRDEIELPMLDTAFERRLPMLAICRGMQLLNVYQGGTLRPALSHPDVHALDAEARHPIVCEPHAALPLLVGEHEGLVNSTHQQAVDRLGHGLQIAAKHADGTIESIEWTRPMRRPWLAAVQWHPERMGLDEPFSGAIYRGFLQAVSLKRDL
ncbi:MAG: gamma-glutamyl-gamma-aminobutyrate hydrolase family protein [Candidatus Aquilonibacter sp.]